MGGWYYEPSTSYSYGTVWTKVELRAHTKQVNSIKRPPFVCGLHITQLQNYKTEYIHKVRHLFSSLFNGCAALQCTSSNLVQALIVSLHRIMWQSSGFCHFSSLFFSVFWLWEKNISIFGSDPKFDFRCHFRCAIAWSVSISSHNSLPRFSIYSIKNLV